LLSPHADFEFAEVWIDGKRVGVLRIAAALGDVVDFEKITYIRVGSYTKKLKDYPALRAKLWDRLRAQKFEEKVIGNGMPIAEVLHDIDCRLYFEKTQLPVPIGSDGYAHYLLEEGVIVRLDDGNYALTNLGAVLFAREFRKFPGLLKKEIRVVRHVGNNRLEMARDASFDRGYAICFEEVVRYVMAMVPSREPIVGAYREKWTAIPEIALREALANAIIHQDFSLSGSGPLVEVFDDRVEISNPGKMLVDPIRVLDTPPRSRNAKLSGLMRRLKLCEESGTGWDKMVVACELLQTCAPKIELYDDFTKVVLFSKVDYEKIPPEERIWSCYMHACIRYLEHEHLTNSSLRMRFGAVSAYTVSRLIKRSLEKGLIRAFDPETAPKFMSYIPFWA
jgi:predicted HTH transcriptional regulator